MASTAKKTNLQRFKIIAHDGMIILFVKRNVTEHLFELTSQICTSAVLEELT
jgi:hypothetical protein